MNMRAFLIATAICGCVFARAFADVEVTINAFNLPSTNDKALPITRENLAVVVVQELKDKKIKSVGKQVFTGPQTKFVLQGIEKNDVLRFSFIRNSPKDRRVTRITEELKGIVVVADTLTLNVVVPVPVVGAPNGLLITDVYRNTAATKMLNHKNEVFFLESGDRLLAINGERLRNTDHFSRVIRANPQNAPFWITMTDVRTGREFDLRGNFDRGGGYRFGIRVVDKEDEEAGAPAPAPYE